MEVKFVTEMRALEDLKEHPRNYRVHPQDQIDHIKASIQEHGVYRNVVVARDNTILAGHGVVKALRQLGVVAGPVAVMDLDPNDPRALKLLAGDNEVEHLAEQDDRLLTDLLKEVQEFDVTGLLGTGYDKMMLANLVYVTRPEDEIPTFDEAAHWVGMPDYDDGEVSRVRLVVSFPDETHRDEFIERYEIRIDKREKRGWSTRWPFTDREDPSALRFEG